MKTLFLLLLLIGCADPHYVNVDELEKQVSNASACELKLLNECLEFTWDVIPNETSVGSFTLKGLIPEDKTLDVYLWMPSMGHGSSPVTITRLAPDSHVISDVFFIMPGPWVIRIQLKDGENVIDKTTLSLTI